jgi:hypothetical protein
MSDLKDPAVMADRINELEQAVVRLECVVHMLVASKIITLDDKQEMMANHAFVRFYDELCSEVLSVQ